ALPLTSTVFPYTTLFRSGIDTCACCSPTAPARCSTLRGYRSGAGERWIRCAHGLRGSPSARITTRPPVLWPTSWRASALAYSGMLNPTCRVALLHRLSWLPDLNHSRLHGRSIAHHGQVDTSHAV